MTLNLSPKAPAEYDPSFFDRVLLRIFQRLARTSTLRSTYTVTNLTPDRTFDASSANAAEVRSALGTLISDLKSQGVIP